MFTSLFRRAACLTYGFAKWSKPKPIPGRSKEQRTAKAIGDDKAAKLSKSELENEAKKKQQEDDHIEEQTKLKMSLIKKHDKSLELHISRSELQRLYNYQLMKIKGVLPRRRKQTKAKEGKIEQPFKLPNELYKQNPVTKKFRPVSNCCVNAEVPLGNYLKQVNKPVAAQVKEFTPTEKSRRLGTVGVKLGMTTLWDDWGHMVPVTVIELDRVQVVQIKEPQNDDGFYHVQLGCGQKNLKRLRKPEIGHFMKAGVPPKKHLAEFKVTKDCLLPIGYMISSRHYTPGMLVDVIGKTVGHGFSGTIKQYRFRRQPATHGNSTTTRVLGSTGCRQDPGRVFKMKKMYGRMGQDITIQQSLRVFKIDVDRNLVYLYGSVPGKAGTVIRLRDNLRYHRNLKNMELGHYPTFVEEEGKQYARQFRMFSGERDPQEIDYNDNAYIIDDGEEDASLSAPPGPPGAAANANIGLPED